MHKREQNMSKRDHFSAPFQLQNVKAVALMNHLLKKSFSLLYIQSKIHIAIKIGAKFESEVDRFYW